MLWGKIIEKSYNQLIGVQKFSAIITFFSILACPVVNIRNYHMYFFQTPNSYFECIRAGVGVACDGVRVLCEQ